MKKRLITCDGYRQRRGDARRSQLAQTKMPPAHGCGAISRQLIAAGFTRKEQLETYPLRQGTYCCLRCDPRLRCCRGAYLTTIPSFWSLGRRHRPVRGPLLRDAAAQYYRRRHIAAPMLEEAMKLQDVHGKKTYDALIRRDMHEFMRTAAAESYDIVMASGVFCYVGDLSDVYAQAARVLKTGGIFAFTADKMDGEGYSGLDPKGPGAFRFSQSVSAKIWRRPMAIERSLKCAKRRMSIPTIVAWLCVSSLNNILRLRLRRRQAGCWKCWPTSTVNVFPITGSMKRLPISFRVRRARRC